MENLTKNNKEKIYLAGIYCRISVEEREKNGIYSDSIKSQIQMAKEYVTNQKNVISVDKYIDDGVSGSSFERPEFRRMLTDIDLGKINMVIVKDISRLGREHILVSYYLEKYFPQRGVRIRALLENYDSKEDLYDGMLNLKILQNDMYLQDISRKTRSVIQAKRKLGEYTAKEPPYGYIKSKKRHNHLEIDTYAAEIVRKIYQMYLDGYGCRAISKILNQEGIICPGRYKKRDITSSLSVCNWQRLMDGFFYK